jgi:hypothetical protein
MNTVINLNHFQTLAEIDTTYPDWRYLGHSGTKWEFAPRGTRVPAPLTGSALASPFKITRDGNREPSIQKYRLWLWKHIRERDEAVISELASIGPDTALACWCAPKHCHCHIVAKAAAWLRRQGATLSPSAERCPEEKAAPADSAPRPKPPLPTRSQPTAYLGDTPHRCAWHPDAALRIYRLPHIGIVHAHRLTNGKWCARVPGRQERHASH